MYVSYKYGVKNIVYCCSIVDIFVTLSSSNWKKKIVDRDQAQIIYNTLNKAGFRFYVQILSSNLTTA